MMVDFIRLNILGDSRQSLTNLLIDRGELKINLETGEVLKQTVNYNDHLKIIIRRNNYIILEGSIHKLLQNGNYKKFTYSDLSFIINKLCNDLNIVDSDCKIMRIEFGVNIFNPQLDFDTIYKNALCYHGEPFDTMKFYKNVFGLSAELQRYVVKIYNKSKQISKSKIISLDEILRYEIRIKNSLQLKSVDVTTLKDILEKEKFYEVISLLINPLQYILFDDLQILANFKNHKLNSFLLTARNPRYWKELKSQDLSLYNNKKKSFQTLLQKNGGINYNDLFTKMVKDEWSYLIAN